MASLFDQLRGDSAILVGGGEGLARQMRKRFSRVIAADPARAIVTRPAVRTLQEGDIHFVAGYDALPESLPDHCDCVMLAFGLAQLDDPVSALTPWITRLRDRGRLVALEWSLHPPSDPPPETALHRSLLEHLEETGQFRSTRPREIMNWLQRAGLIHVRYSHEPSQDLFTREDLAFLAAEGISRLVSLGEGDGDLAQRLRTDKFLPLPVIAAHGTFKPVHSVEELRHKAEVAEDGTGDSQTTALRRTERNLTDLVAAVLGQEVDDPEEAASQLLANFGARALTALRDPRQIREAVGLPLRHAKRLLDALELGRRLFDPARLAGIEIHGPEDAYELLREEMAGLKKEQFRGLYLNVKGRLEADEVISIGTLTSSLVHPREVFGPALEKRCHSVLIAHNHPSGDPTPSPEDIHLTRELADAGRLLGIELLDHLILGGDSYLSMKERNYF